MEDRFGIFTFLTGMIVLIGAAVGLSLLVEKRSTFTEGRNGLKEAIAMNHEDLVCLKEDLAAASARWQAGKGRIDQGRRLAAANALVNDAPAKISALSAHRDGLTADVSQINANFVKYQTDYCNRIWGSAIGEKLGSLRTLSGREYLNVMITRVSSSGLEIRHENGIARIQESDLGSEWQDRFQWQSPGSRLTMK